MLRCAVMRIDRCHACPRLSCPVPARRRRFLSEHVGHRFNCALVCVRVHERFDGDSDASDSIDLKSGEFTIALEPAASNLADARKPRLRPEQRAKPKGRRRDRRRRKQQAPHRIRNRNRPRNQWQCLWCPSRRVRQSLDGRHRSGPSYHSVPSVPFGFHSCDAGRIGWDRTRLVWLRSVSTFDPIHSDPVSVRFRFGSFDSIRSQSFVGPHRPPKF